MILLFLLAACGKVGDPQPPFIRIPEAVNDLAVRQLGPNLVLTWTDPARNIDASTATDLSRIRILADGAVLAVHERTVAGQPNSFTVPIGSSTGMPRTFSIQVETAGGKMSEVSNLVSITPIEAPGSVANFQIIVDQHRIILEWDPPLQHPELAASYAVKREDLDEVVSVNETRWEDAAYEPGQTYRYQITPVRQLGDQSVEGVAAGPVSIEAIDKTPPRVPSGLMGTAADPGGFITWTANEERDFAGYHVFRSNNPDAGFTRIGDSLHKTNALFDPDYRPGIYYAVSAADEFGNESAPSTPFRVQ